MSSNLNQYLKLELLDESHAEELFLLTEKNREFLKEWLPWVDGTKSVNDTLTFVKNSIIKNETNNGFENIIKYKNQIAGITGLLYINHFNRKTEIGYWLGREFNGRGIMTEACARVINNCFTKLNLNRIEIRCAVNNKRSQGIPERLNFTKEGILRKEVFLNGEFVDHILYSILKDEWNKISNHIQQ
ncbi:MAG: GNAT family protein [Ignavibacteriaceae bacterium]